MKLIICGPWCTKLFELVINRDKPFKLHISRVNEDGRGAAQPQHTNYCNSNGPATAEGTNGFIPPDPIPAAGRFGRYGEGLVGQTSPAPLGVCFIGGGRGSFPLTNKTHLYEMLQYDLSLEILTYKYI